MSQVLNMAELSKRYPVVNGTITEAEYLFEIVECARFVDAGDENSELVNWTRFINHSSKAPNLEIKINAAKNMVWFNALRNIKDGEELLFDYGDKYWESFDGVIVQ